MADIAKFTLVQVSGQDGDHSSVVPWQPGGHETPGLSTAHKIRGVTMTDSDYQEPVQVMKRGYLRDVAAQNSETWSAGDVLWAKADGSITKTRPTDCPLVMVGVVIGGTSPALVVDVDVRVVPSLGELSGVSVETPADLDVFIFDSTNGVWEPRRLSGDDVTNTASAHLASTTVQAAIDELAERDWTVAFLMMGV